MNDKDTILYIEIAPGVVTLVDSDIWKKTLRWHKWKPQTHRGGKYIYIASSLFGQLSYMHRVVAGAQKGQIVDHINGNTLDNRRENLRICTSSQNSANGRGRKPAMHGLKGLCRAGKRWAANIVARGAKYYLGTFDHKDRAAKAYDRAALYFHGEFAVLNFEELRATYRPWKPTEGYKPTILRTRQN